MYLSGLLQDFLFVFNGLYRRHGNDMLNMTHSVGFLVFTLFSVF